MTYRLFLTNNFQKKRRKLEKSFNKKRAIKKCLDQLKTDPFYKSLKTHKAETKYSDRVYSSWVLGDLRISWNFNDDHIDVIDIFDIGNHNYYK